MQGASGPTAFEELGSMGSNGVHPSCEPQELEVTEPPYVLDPVG